MNMKLSNHYSISANKTLRSRSETSTCQPEIKAKDEYRAIFKLVVSEEKRSQGWNLDLKFEPGNGCWQTRSNDQIGFSPFASPMFFTRMPIPPGTDRTISPVNTLILSVLRSRTFNSMVWPTDNESGVSIKRPSGQAFFKTPL